MFVIGVLVGIFGNLVVSYTIEVLHPIAPWGIWVFSAILAYIIMFCVLYVIYQVLWKKLRTKKEEKEVTQ